MSAIEARQLSKSYRQYAKPFDLFKEWLLRKPFHNQVDALAPIDLTIPKGTTFGVIGDNGAGKSTLLKLLAGTLTPTTGSLHIEGRKSAILELGSGFHPEFSGLENIQLACSLLGLSAAETAERTPQIIEFSELGVAIHRPVKSYSSGMFVRLAFSVITSIDPDVLIVDEALSVGDALFQKKSMDRMMKFRDEGRTLVFCSHNLYQVKELCEQAVWLENGVVRGMGESAKVVDDYQDSVRQRQKAGSIDRASPDAEAASDVYLAEVVLEGGIDTAENIPLYQTGDHFAIRVEADIGSRPADDVHIGLVLIRNDGLQVYGVSTLIDQLGLYPIADKRYGVRLVFDPIHLMSGDYALEAWLIDRSGLHVYDSRPVCCQFRVRHESSEVGIVKMSHQWEPIA
ncbi:MAG: ABC transporter ATP-binding protein [Candidatus Thiodiazotropha taylori]|uniref:ABC transporter ATP-binding protein n=1 Tax=Candidatus Thiodiazotropha taylori TaxID=2792791 RepID=A0A9E4N4I0_9GAMM|nr:ABC transporter ATP-binding protein [Candidatus Thiodiazotropha taylori]MCG7945893.1 ABC transporter ATP-binding protein [Candidatus Thiodiazotropha taylori]MCG7966237.1 ABC transporter ATP-binding protein [Candidatus Thiodiazotropha taylori]MCW4256017.1 ABC transporter ATP-binding protein [Candidatus Thiodiazotropha taylori]